MRFLLKLILISKFYSCFFVAQLRLKVKLGSLSTIRTGDFISEEPSGMNCQSMVVINNGDADNMRCLCFSS